MAKWLLPTVASLWDAVQKYAHTDCHMPQRAHLSTIRASLNVD